mmetsp:Transcript_48144/g.145412  ORF Transcript_48144/g.145412 Transcript_48144/m.145412 type:complete len:359 (-) Transcript_48144:470-1546(-)
MRRRRRLLPRRQQLSLRHRRRKRKQQASRPGRHPPRGALPVVEPRGPSGRRHRGGGPRPPTAAGRRRRRAGSLRVTVVPGRRVPRPSRGRAGRTSPRRAVLLRPVDPTPSRAGLRPRRRRELRELLLPSLPSRPDRLDRRPGIVQPIRARSGERRRIGSIPDRRSDVLGRASGGTLRTGVAAVPRFVRDLLPSRFVGQGGERECRRWRRRRRRSRSPSARGAREVRPCSVGGGIARERRDRPRRIEIVRRGARRTERRQEEGTVREDTRRADDAGGARADCGGIVFGGRTRQQGMEGRQRRRRAPLRPYGRPPTVRRVPLRGRGVRPAGSGRRRPPRQARRGVERRPGRRVQGRGDIV